MMSRHAIRLTGLLLLTAAVIAAGSADRTAPPVCQVRPPGQADPLPTDPAALTPEQLVMLSVLFLPWLENKPTPPPPPGDPAGGGGSGTNDPGNSGNPSDPGSPKDPGGTDPGNVQFSHNPEPATLLTGMLGAGLLVLAGWRRLRS